MLILNLIFVFSIPGDNLKNLIEMPYILKNGFLNYQMYPIKISIIGLMPAQNIKILIILLPLLLIFQNKLNPLYYYTNTVPNYSHIDINFSSLFPPFCLTN